MINVAIIGAGWFGKYHLETCMKEKNVFVKALVCTNAGKHKDINIKYPALPIYESFEELFVNEKNLDALIIAVPPYSHSGIEHMAVERNINLFIEKPLGTDKNIVLNNLDLIKKSKIITSVGYHTRYNPAISALKTSLEKEIIGIISIKWIDTMPTTPWWRIKEKSGGQIVEQVTHYIDAIRYLIGDINEVAAFSRNDLNDNVENFSTDSASVAILKFRNGCIATLEVGCYKTAGSDNDISLTIHTKDKTAKYYWNSYSTLEDKKFPAAQVDKIYRLELQTFFKAIENNNQNIIKCSYEEGVKTFLTTIALEKSLAENNIINVDSLYIKD